MRRKQEDGGEERDSDRRCVCVCVRVFDIFVKGSARGSPVSEMCEGSVAVFVLSSPSSLQDGTSLSLARSCKRPSFESENHSHFVCLNMTEDGGMFCARVLES